MPFDIISNPKVVISRTNPSQVLETVLARMARRTGKPYAVSGFSGQDMRKFVMDELAKNNESEYEPVYDPVSGKTFTNVLSGEQYYLKLHHLAESKGSGRDVGSYTAEEQPAKGSGDTQQSKRLAGMDVNALISHGAVNTIKDAKLYRGQSNPEFWQLFKLGYPVPTPGRPFVYDKFMDYLKGAGINVNREADGLRFMALTNKDIKAMRLPTLSNASAVDARTSEPIMGGLFDPGLTGGMGGRRWSKIDLAEPMPSPIMEDPIRSILGLTKNQYHDLIAKPNENGSLLEQLQKIDMDREMLNADTLIRTGKGAKRSAAIKKMRFLKGLKDANIHPSDLVWDSVPVIPPAMRPVTKINNMQLVSDANLLYKDLWDTNQAYGALKGQVGDTSAERLALYRSLKAVTGLDDPVSQDLQTKNVGGLLAHAMGKSSPKFSMFQRKVLTTTLDTVGRGAIAPNPHLDMDQIGVPEEQAWSVYRPFIMRHMMKRYATSMGHGVSPLEVATMIENRDPRARTALLEVMKERPVLANRAPVLHRYGIQAFWPTLVPGHTIQISPAVTEGFNADFDGDTMNFHVPVSDAAVKEAVEKLMPSRNLMSATSFGPAFTPRHEYLHGLYLATRKQKASAARKFESVEAVARAIANGQLSTDEPVEVIENSAQAG